MIRCQMTERAQRSLKQFKAVCIIVPRQSGMTALSKHLRRLSQIDIEIEVADTPRRKLNSHSLFTLFNSKFCPKYTLRTCSSAANSSAVPDFNMLPS